MTTEIQIVNVSQRDQSLFMMRTVQEQLPLRLSSGLSFKQLTVRCNSCHGNISPALFRGLVFKAGPEGRVDAVGLCKGCMVFSRFQYDLSADGRVSTSQQDASDAADPSARMVPLEKIAPQGRVPEAKRPEAWAAPEKIAFRPIRSFLGIPFLIYAALRWIDWALFGSRVKGPKAPRPPIK